MLHIADLARIDRVALRRLEGSSAAHPPSSPTARKALGRIGRPVDGFRHPPDGRDLPDPADQRPDHEDHDENGDDEQQQPPGIAVEARRSPMMPTTAKRKAPMKTEIEVWALRSPTISGIARGVVAAEALARC